MEKQFDIFINYRRNGGETTADLLKSELSHLGYRVFLDFDDLPIGGNLEERICNVIKSSHFVGADTYNYDVQKARLRLTEQCANLPSEAVESYRGFSRKFLKITRDYARSYVKRENQ